MDESANTPPPDTSLSQVNPPGTSPDTGGVQVPMRLPEAPPQTPELLKQPLEFDPDRAVLDPGQNVPPALLARPPEPKVDTTPPPLLARPKEPDFDPSKAVPSEQAQQVVARDNINQFLSGQKDMSYDQFKVNNDLAEGGTSATGRAIKGIWNIGTGLGSAAKGLFTSPEERSHIASWIGTRAQELVEPYIDAGHALANGDPVEAAKLWATGEATAMKNVGTGIVGGTAGMASTAVGASQGMKNVMDELSGLNLIKRFAGIDDTKEKYLSASLQNKINKATNELYTTTDTSPDNVFTQVGELVPWIAASEVTGVGGLAGAAGRLGDMAPDIALKATAIGAKGAEFGVREGVPLAAGAGVGSLFGHPVLGGIVEAVANKILPNNWMKWPANIVHSMADWPADQIGKLVDLASTAGRPGQAWMDALSEKFAGEAEKSAGVANDLRAGAEATDVVKYLNPDNSWKLDPDTLAPKARESFLKSVPKDISAIVDVADEAKALQSKADLASKFLKANKIAASFTRGAVATGATIGEAALTGGAMAGAESAPGDISRIQEGGNALALMAAPFAPFGAAAGLSGARMVDAARHTMALGKGNLFGDVSDLPPEWRDYVQRFAGMTKPMDSKVIVHTAEEARAEQGLSSDQSPGNGWVDNDGNIHLVKERIGSGVAGHEFTHATQGFFGEMLRKLAPDQMQEFETKYGEALSRTGKTGFDSQSERDAEVGRYVLQNTPIEMFFGGERGGDIMKRWVSNLLGEGETMTIPGFNAPVTRADIASMKQRFFRSGELAARTEPGSTGPPPVPRSEILQQRVQDHINSGMTEDEAIQKVAAELSPQESFVSPETGQTFQRPGGRQGPPVGGITHQFMPEMAPDTEEFKRWSGGAPVILNSGPKTVRPEDMGLQILGNDNDGYTVAHADGTLAFGGTWPKLSLMQAADAKSRLAVNMAEAAQHNSQAHNFQTGQPVVVGAYHGTPSDTFHVFDPYKLGVYTGAPSAKQGFFFSGLPDTAETYKGGLLFPYKGFKEMTEHQRGTLGKKMLENMMDESRGPKGVWRMHSHWGTDPDVPRGPAVTRWALTSNDGTRIESNLSEVEAEKKMSEHNANLPNYDNTYDYATANPDMLKEEAKKITGKELDMTPADAGHLHEVYVKMQNPYVYDFKGNPYREQTYNDLLRSAKAQGHDGAIFTNTYDGGGKPDNIFVTFDNKNIKSTANMGSFDPSNPDIRYMPQPDNPDAVKGAAIKLPDGRILTGSWHGVIDKQVPPEFKKLAVDGFVTGNGRFLTRDEAWVVGKRYGQIPKYARPLNQNEVREGKSLRPQLISEDIRPPAYMPDPDVARSAEDYMKEAGLPYAPHRDNQPVNEGQAKAIADHYATLPHDPHNPEVKQAYQALINETIAQGENAMAHGYKFEPWTQKGQPYANSAEMLKDVRDNKHLWYFPTEAGYGEGGAATDHPMLQPVKFGGKVMPANDVFRAVHDLYGHAESGWQFGPRGETNAYLSHSKMFSDDAQPALAMETLGQNSWVNFGPHMRGEGGKILQKGDEGYLGPTERPYADQKANVINVPEYESWRGEKNALADFKDKLSGRYTPGQDVYKTSKAQAYGPYGERSRLKREGEEGSRYMPEVNIGMNVDGKEALTSKDIAEALEAVPGVKVTKLSEQRKEGFEPTTVATLSRALTATEGDAVSRALKQDAIAQHQMGGQGNLYGPRTDKYGAEANIPGSGFDPGQFLTHDGEILSDVMQRLPTRTGASGIWDRMTVDPNFMQGEFEKAAEATGANPKERFTRQTPAAQKAIQDYFTGRGEAQYMPSPAGELKWTSRHFDMTPDQLEQFLIFGRSVAGHASKDRAPMIERALTDLLNTQGGTSPITALQKLNQTEGGIEAFVRKHGFGPYGENIRFLKHLAESRIPDLKTATEEELQNIPGIGPKTARFFKAHTDITRANNVMLDTHILRFLRETGYPDAPTSTPQDPKVYEKYSNAFRDVADEFGLSPSDLDLQIWLDRSGNMPTASYRGLENIGAGRDQFMPNPHPDAIKEPAIRTPDGEVIHAPVGYHSMIPLTRDQKVQFNKLEMGFISNKHTKENPDFMNRTEALARALKHKQISEAAADPRNWTETAIDQQLHAPDVKEGTTPPWSYMPDPELEKQTNLARSLAEEAHKGQERKFTGTPYYSHLSDVADLVDDKLKPAAYLHDVFEDTPLKVADLRAMGISNDNIELIRNLTRRPNEDYDHYIQRIKGNPDARDIKMADLWHNLSTLPVGHSLQKRYVNAMNELIPTDEQLHLAHVASGHPERAEKVGGFRGTPAGTPMTMRIDIPAYLATGEYSISGHEGNIGDVKGYDGIATIDNPVFKVNQSGAEKVKNGVINKYPMAAISGEFNPSRVIPNDIGDYQMAGFNPKKHAYLYEKGSFERDGVAKPIKSGDQAISAGNTVFVKNPVYGNPAEYKFMPDVPQAIDRAAIKRNSDGKIFSAGQNTPHWMIPSEHPDIGNYFGANADKEYQNGFLDNQQNFHDRETAHQIMTNNGQLPKDYQGEYSGEANVTDLKKSRAIEKLAEEKPPEPGKPLAYMPSTPEDAAAAIEEGKQKFPEAFPRDYEKDKDGNYKLKYDKQAKKKQYVPVEKPFDLTQSGLYAQSKDQADFEKKMVDKVVQEHNNVWSKDPETMQAKGWYDIYNTMREKGMSHEQATRFLDTAAATSARARAGSQFVDSLEAHNRMEAGDFDEIIKKYKEAYGKQKAGDLTFNKDYTNAQKKKYQEGDPVDSASAFRDYVEANNLVLRKSNEKRFGMHSYKVLQVMAGHYVPEGLKYVDFFNALTGRSTNPVIDIWSYRNIDRLANEGYKPVWRRLPENEPGVNDPDYLTSRRIMLEAAKKLGYDNPTDLQAIQWFGEKKQWYKNKWARDLDLGDYRPLLQRFEPVPGAKGTQFRLADVQPPG